MQKHGVRAIGLALVAVLSMMALAASTAHAAEVVAAKRFLHNNGTFFGESSETATGNQEETGILKIPAKNSEIRCEKTEVSEGQIKNTAAKGEGSGTVTFSSCKVFQESSGSELAACTKVFNENNNGGKPTAQIKTLPWLYSTTGLHQWWAWLHPFFGSTFTTLVFGGTCSLPEKAAITGSVRAAFTGTNQGKEAAEDESKLKIKLDSGGAGMEGTFLQGILAEGTKAELKFGANPAFIKGKAYIELTGANAGAPWGVM